MNKKIFFVGTGNMGGAILRGLLSAGTAASEISFLEPNDKAAEAYTALGCVRKASFADGVAAADVTFLCVKPQIFKLVAKEWESAMQSQKSEKTFISIMAGVKRESLLAVLGSKSQVLRVMPNLPLHGGTCHRRRHRRHPEDRRRNFQHHRSHLPRHRKLDGRRHRTFR